MPNLKFEGSKDPPIIVKEATLIPDKDKLQDSQPDISDQSYITIANGHKRNQNNLESLFRNGLSSLANRNEGQVRGIDTVQISKQTINTEENLPTKLNTRTTSRNEAREVAKDFKSDNSTKYNLIIMEKCCNNTNPQISLKSSRRRYNQFSLYPNTTMQSKQQIQNNPCFRNRFRSDVASGSSRVKQMKLNQHHFQNKRSPLFSSNLVGPQFFLAKQPNPKKLQPIKNDEQVDQQPEIGQNQKIIETKGKKDPIYQFIDNNSKNMRTLRFNQQNNKFDKTGIRTRNIKYRSQLQRELPSIQEQSKINEQMVLDQRGIADKVSKRQGSIVNSDVPFESLSSVFNEQANESAMKTRNPPRPLTQMGIIENNENNCRINYIQQENENKQQHAKSMMSSRNQYRRQRSVFSDYDEQKNSARKGNSTSYCENRVRASNYYQNANQAIHPKMPYNNISQFKQYPSSIQGIDNQQTINNDVVQAKIDLNLHSSQQNSRNTAYKYSTIGGVSRNDKSLLINKPIQSFYNHYQRPVTQIQRLRLPNPIHYQQQSKQITKGKINSNNETGIICKQIDIKDQYESIMEQQKRNQILRAQVTFDQGLQCAEKLENQYLSYEAKILSDAIKNQSLDLIKSNENVGVGSQYALTPMLEDKKQSILDLKKATKSDLVSPGRFSLKTRRMSTQGSEKQTSPLVSPRFLLSADKQEEEQKQQNKIIEQQALLLSDREKEDLKDQLKKAYEDQNKKTKVKQNNKYDNHYLHQLLRTIHLLISVRQQELENLDRNLHVPNKIINIDNQKEYRDLNNTNFNNQILPDHTTTTNNDALIKISEQIESGANLKQNTQMNNEQPGNQIDNQKISHRSSDFKKCEQEKQDYVTPLKENARPKTQQGKSESETIIKNKTSQKTVEVHTSLENNSIKGAESPINENYLVTSTSNDSLIKVQTIAEKNNKLNQNEEGSKKSRVKDLTIKVKEAQKIQEQLMSTDSYKHNESTMNAAASEYTMNLRSKEQSGSEKYVPINTNGLQCNIVIQQNKAYGAYNNAYDKLMAALQFTEINKYLESDEQFDPKILTAKLDGDIINQINWENMDDNEMLYIMYLQHNGLDYRGQPIKQQDQQLENQINRYLNRQILAPKHYKLLKPSKNEIKKSVYFKMQALKDQKFLKDRRSSIKQYQPKELKAFAATAYQQQQNDQQESQIQQEISKYMINTELIRQQQTSNHGTTEYSENTHRSMHIHKPLLDQQKLQQNERQLDPIQEVRQSRRKSSLNQTPKLSPFARHQLMTDLKDPFDANNQFQQSAQNSFRMKTYDIEPLYQKQKLVLEDLNSYKQDQEQQLQIKQSPMSINTMNKEQTPVSNSRAIVLDKYQPTEQNVQEDRNTQIQMRTIESFSSPTESPTRKKQEELWSTKLQKEEKVSKQLGKLYILQGIIENQIQLNELDSSIEHHFPVPVESQNQNIALTNIQDSIGLTTIEGSLENIIETPNIQNTQYVYDRQKVKPNIKPPMLQLDQIKEQQEQNQQNLIKLNNSTRSNNQEDSIINTQRDSLNKDLIFRTFEAGTIDTGESRRYNLALRNNSSYHQHGDDMKQPVGSLPQKSVVVRGNQKNKSLQTSAKTRFKLLGFNQQQINEQNHNQDYQKKQLLSSQDKYDGLRFNFQKSRDYEMQLLNLNLYTEDSEKRKIVYKNEKVQAKKVRKQQIDIFSNEDDRKNNTINTVTLRNSQEASPLVNEPIDNDRDDSNIEDKTSRSQNSKVNKSKTMIKIKNNINVCNEQHSQDQDLTQEIEGTLQSPGESKRQRKIDMNLVQSKNEE